MMKTQSYHGLLGAALLLAMAGGVTAQEFRATVKGQVVDSSQAALPGATVNVQNQETNEVATATTNNEGYLHRPVPPARAVHPDRRDAAASRNTRATDCGSQSVRRRTINVALAVGGVAEEVTVTAESPLLETSKADRGTVIDSARIAELPLQSRSPMALAVLVAGVNYNAQAIYLRPFDNGALADWSMNGGQNRNNEFLLDGAPNNANQGGNNIAYVPPAEAVQEFKVSTNSYDAQYGRTAGGVVNMSLKSGTNSFHGVVYDFMRRKALAANSFLLNSRNAPKTDQYIDQYGFSVDGPIWKNKTFFLFTGEKYREGTPAPLFSTVPTRGDEERRLQRSRGCVGTPDRRSTTRPPAATSTACGRAIRSPATSFPPIRINANGPGDHAVLPGPERHDGRRGAMAAEPALPPSTSTRTCSGTGSARSTTTSARTIAPSSAGVRTSATRSRNTGQRHPQRPGPGRPASALARQPRARRRLGAHLRRRDGVQPARQLHLLPGVELFRRRARFRCDGVLALEPRQPVAQPGRSAASSRGSRSTSSRPCRAADARTGTGTTRFSRTSR